MPYGRKTAKKTYRKRYKKKPYARKPTYPRRNNNNRGNVLVSSQRPTIQRGYLPFGQTYFAKLPFVHNNYVTADGTTGTTNVPFTLSSNNAFDPLYNVGGHSPLQYIVLQAHYERVWVWGCAVELTFSNPTYDGMWVGYRCRASTNSTATIGRTLTHVQELRDSAIRPINNTGKQSTTFKFYISNPKLFGITKSQYNNIDYSHLTTDDPAIYGWIEPFALHTITGETSNIRVNIKMTYYCQFTNPISELQNP